MGKNQNKITLKNLIDWYDLKNEHGAYMPSKHLDREVFLVLNKRMKSLGFTYVAKRGFVDEETLFYILKDSVINRES